MADDKELLNVRIKNGTFYISSKEEQTGKGWTKQEFKNPQSGEHMVRWHKEITIKGRLNWMALQEDKYRGKVLSLIVGGEDESYVLTVPVFNPNGKVKTTDEYFNSLVGALENVSKGDEITMFVNNKNKDKNDRLYRNIVVLDSDNKLIKSNYSFEDIPNWTSTEKTDEFDETVKVWDATPANKFFIDQAKKVVDAFGNGSSNSTPTPTQTDTPEAPVVEDNSDEYDDLPF